MEKMHSYILSVMYMLVGIFTASAQAVDFHYFRNISLDAKASTVHAFAQDSLGLLWLGSNNGLYHYDGYTLHAAVDGKPRSEEHTSELQSRENLVCRLLLEKKNNVYQL